MPRKKQVEIVQVGWSLVRLSAVAWAMTLGHCSSSSDAAAEPLEWHDCSGGMQCASLVVPVDWAYPGGPKLQLHLARRPSADPAKRLGSVLFNPGGPGGNGIPDLERKAATFENLRQRFDVVTWEPRGSESTFEKGEEHDGCFATVEPGRPTDDVEWERLSQKNLAVAERCRRHHPVRFDHVDSLSQARDMEAIRRALGDEKLNYLGVSYGGVFGVAYARLFPQQLRAMVLDSVVDHLADASAYDEMRDRTAETPFARFVTWCSASTDCVLQKEDVSAVWTELLNRADETPIPARNGQDDVHYAGVDLEAFAGAYLATERWNELAQGIDQARRGDATLLSAPGRGGKLAWPNFLTATQCGDGWGYRQIADYRAAQERNRRLAPHLPRWQTALGTMCIGSPVPVSNPHAALDATGLPPALVLTSLAEEEEAKDLKERLVGSALVRVDHAAHSLYLGYANPCAIEHANHYFVDLTLPVSTVTCPMESAINRGFKKR
ncbi:alpha/beta hydrolase [Pendulispora brunnea]|uniref:Alpha/beta hydrolase n=1 Tax=Pendulispora brunnea TaxID=2905690 RepID=A0ABZ2K8A3_9BACT